MVCTYPRVCPRRCSTRCRACARPTRLRHAAKPRPCVMCSPSNYTVRMCVGKVVCGLCRDVKAPICHLFSLSWHCAPGLHACFAILAWSLASPSNPERACSHSTQAGPILTSPQPTYLEHSADLHGLCGVTNHRTGLRLKLLGGHFAVVANESESCVTAAYIVRRHAVLLESVKVTSDVTDGWQRLFGQ